MSGETQLQIVFHMVNGHALKFSVKEESSAAEIIRNVRPQKLFSEKQLVISGKLSSRRIFLDAVSHIEFNTAAKPDWAFPSYFDGISILSKDAFFESAKTVCTGAAVSGQANLFAELLMGDGSMWYLHVWAKTMTPAERMDLLQVLRHLEGFHASKSDGGSILFNMKNVVSWSVYPSPAEIPPKAWLV